VWKHPFLVRASAWKDSLQTEQTPFSCCKNLCIYHCSQRGHACRPAPADLHWYDEGIIACTCWSQQIFDAIDMLTGCCWLARVLKGAAGVEMGSEPG